jgi:chaperone modulatory protein CbpM
MQHDEIATGLVVDDDALSIEELARACAVEPDWVVEHLEARLFSDGSLAISTQRFSSIDLRRARRLVDLERNFDATRELAALMADMLEEIDRLRARLRSSGVEE